MMRTQSIVVGRSLFERSGPDGGSIEETLVQMWHPSNSATIKRLV
jgi:hypothetical protein